MTHYEAYLQFSKSVKALCESINKALGRNAKGEYDKGNDKHQFKFSLSPKSLELGYGYYGSSSYYSCIGDSAIAYIQRACNDLAPMIGARAMELAKFDLEEKRKLALVEAQSVIQDTEEVSR